MDRHARRRRGAMVAQRADDRDRAMELRSAGTGLFREADRRTLVPLVIATAIALGLYAGVMDRTAPRPTDAIPRYAPRVTINLCDWAELCLLPGVSRTRAERIVAERQANGPFRSMNDLLRVSGIGPKTCERLVGRLDFSCSSHRSSVDDGLRKGRLE